MKRHLHWYIYRALGALLKLNTRIYGAGASRELLRDLYGEQLENQPRLKF